MIESLPKTKFSYRAALFFLDAGHYLFCSYDDRRKSSKFVAAPDVAAAFAGQEQDSGWFPAGVVRCGTNERGAWFVYSAPAQKVEVNLYDKDMLTIPIPRTVLMGIGNKFYLWVTVEEQFNQNANIYRAPFPNVHGDGEICWGSNQPPAAHPGNSRKVWEQFFATPFNNHLADGKSKFSPGDVREMLRRLSGKRRYPADDLVKTNYSVDQLIERILH